MADDLQRAVRGETARRSWSAPEPCTDAAADGEALPTELCCEHPEAQREGQTQLMQGELNRDWNATADPKLPSKVVSPGVGYQADAE
ncbi:hypothetical protein MNEG_9173 [Monoraphidium neglectum]|uniref:Uncharacterized protein n=1 Tax=Monoraphidium neglectum TaxID=145388 RepID=A0A0D2MX33_9CHLO|nr:hypothetical protein MNEG_9173 [Monoraphidium neglectum]KIY98790.1 hypothetical protein MNEG_9173 [Monoraphidium neglectum]|eukprot:XP_013897810.1 hypothetical protein MNEG_9173 [Monoraphidium neglectum]